MVKQNLCRFNGYIKIDSVGADISEDSYRRSDEYDKNISQKEFESFCEMFFYCLFAAPFDLFPSEWVRGLLP